MPLTAVMTMASFTISFTRALTTTSKVHTVPWLKLSAAPCGARPDRLWKVTDAAPYDRPTAAAVNTRRCKSVCRTRHWVNAVWAIGMISA